MSIFKLAIFYLFWIVIVALTVNVFNVYANLEKPSLGFFDGNESEKFLAPSVEINQIATHQEFASIKSPSISNFNFSFVKVKADYLFNNLGQFLIPLLLLMMIIPPFFFLMKKNVNKSLKWRFSVLIMGGLGIISAFYLTEKYELINTSMVSSSTKLMFAFLSLACFSYALWLLFRVYISFSGNSSKEYIKPLRNILNYFVPILLCLLMIETLLLFMDVSVLFPTTPKMGGYWFSPQISKGVVNTGIASLFTQEVSLKFIQKIFSYTVLVFIFVMLFKSRTLPRKSRVKKSIRLLTLFLCLQIIIGLVSNFLLELSFVGGLHHVASLCILGVSIHLFALSSDYGVDYKFVSPKFKLNGYHLDVAVAEELLD